MTNMEIYEAARRVDDSAKKQFNNGRFSGTDINPMWRIKKLTELFGPSGIGWYYKVTDKHSETLDADTVMAVVDIELFIKVNGEWSMPIYGTGGNLLKAKGKPSDEGYKMALTDAISVACKALGIGADVYYEKDASSKYAQYYGGQSAPAPEEKKPTAMMLNTLVEMCSEEQKAKLFAKYGNGLPRLSYSDCEKLIKKLEAERK